MTDAATPGAFSPSGAAGSAGEMLREARRAQGLEVDALASMIKVTPAKLEALERGEYSQLPDANFTRALAMTVCRSLKIDPGPVLAALPAAKAIPLSPNKPALNQPFKESRGANLSFDTGQSFDFKSLLKPQWLAPILLLLASVLVYVLPDTIQWPHWLTQGLKPAQQAASALPASSPAPLVAASVALPASAPAPALATSAPETLPQEELASVAAAVASAVPEAASLALPASSAASPLSVPSQASAASGGGALVLTSREAAWVQVRDGRGTSLLSRHLKAGETVDLSGVPPFKLLLGNASGLQVVYQGRPVDLATSTRNNVARLELK